MNPNDPNAPPSNPGQHAPSPNRTQRSQQTLWAPPTRGGQPAPPDPNAIPPTPAPAPRPTNPVPAVIEPGAILFDRYQVERLLGEGGMGQVWGVTHLQLGTRRVVKLIRVDRAAEARNFDRFQREATLLAHLNHPGIVQIHDFFLDAESGKAYIEMEWIDGKSLDKVLALKPGQPRSYAWSYEVVRQLCNVLKAVHTEGIVHRDLKPGNLMLRDRVDGRLELKVLDFGLAKMIDDVGDVTQSKDAPFTLAYAAPEQIDPSINQNKIDHRADLYAVGVMLYEFLAGRRPFVAGKAELIANILHSVPSPPSEHNPKISKDLDAFVLRCLAKKPADRPQSARKLFEELKEALNRSGELRVESRRVIEPDEPTYSNDNAPASQPQSATKPGTGSNQAVSSSLPSDVHNDVHFTDSFGELKPTSASSAPTSPISEGGTRQRSQARFPWNGLAVASLIAISVFVALIKMPFAGESNSTPSSPPDERSVSKPDQALKDAQPSPDAPAVASKPDQESLAPSPQPDRVASPPPASWEGQRAGELKVVRLGDEELRFRWCPPGSFRMGSPPEEVGRFNDEAQVDVRLTRGFWMQEVEVTQGLWRAAGGPALDWSSMGAGPRLPVYNVNHHEAVAFAASLTEQLRASGELPVGWRLSLPSEAQWEYAARAGTTTRFPFGDDESRLGDYAWYGGNSGEKPDDVGTLRANDWEIKDMLGNVWEWCVDGYVEQLPGGADPMVDPAQSSRRVNRGGSWGNTAWDCRPAYRNTSTPEVRHSLLGFRLVVVQSPG